MYEKLKNEFNGYPLFQEGINKQGNVFFCFWDSKSYYAPAKSRKNTASKGHKRLIVVCSKCLEDDNKLFASEVENLQIATTVYKIKKGETCCGCNKRGRNKVLLSFGIDEHIGKKFKYETNTLEVVKYHSGIGNTKKYELYCNVCSKDSELWPQGSLLSTIGNLNRNTNKPCCGCNPDKVWWTEFQYKIRVERICKEKGLTFKGWFGDKFHKNARNTRLNLLCDLHGLSTNTHLAKFLSREGGCRECSQQKGKWGYYEDNLKNKDYLYLLKGEKDGEIFFKMGRSFDPKRRLRQHTSLSGYNFSFEGLVEDTHETVYNKELHLKLKLRHYLYKPDHPWNSSAYECFTQEILSHPDIIATFNLTSQHPSDTL